MQFDCARCEELLLDFAYGELDELTSAAFRRHADGCARCTASLGDVRMVRDAFGMLPMETPAAALDARILAAAEARRIELQASSRPAASPAEPRSWWERFLDGFRTVAMRPQYAMAMLLVLVVGIVLALAPQMNRSPSAPVMLPDVVGDAPDMVGEAAPVVAAQAPPPPQVVPVPATPAQGAAPEATRQATPAPALVPMAPPLEQTSAAPRPRTFEFETERLRAPSPSASRGAPVLEGRAAAVSEGGGGDEARQSTAPRDHVATTADPRELRREEAQGQAQRGFAAPPARARALDLAEMPSSEGDGVYSANRGDDRARMRFAQPPAPARGPSAGLSVAAPSVPAPSPSAPSAPSVSQQSQPRAVGPSLGGAAGVAGGTDSFERGMTRYRSGQYRQAIADLEAAIGRPGLAGDSLAVAQLTIARSYRQVGNCSEATRRYEDIMRRFTGYTQNADVSWEAAECYRTLGNTARADQLYRVAERTGRYAERARARRVQMEGARRAARSARDSYEEAVEPAQAAPAATTVH